MNNIRELTSEEIILVSGGNANSNYERGESRNRNTGARNSLAKNAPTHIYNSADSCAAGILGGLIAGSPGGPVGMLAGALVGLSQVNAPKRVLAINQTPVVKIQLIISPGNVVGKLSVFS